MGASFERILAELPHETVIGVHLPGDSFPLIEGIASDSRQVLPGYLFVALEGGNVDGHKFIEQAISKGASVVIGSRHIEGLAVPYIRVADSRQALAQLSAAFYDHPARKMVVIGVTGTDGKTTTTTLIYHILQAAGLPAGMISTVSAVIGERLLDTGFHVTTPEAPDVQRYLAQMVATGASHVVLEATSHGLAQRRVAACDFDFGVVTNITHEHLDYHGDYEAYRAAKASLFTSLVGSPPKPGCPERAAILNLDDEAYPFLAQVVPPGVRPISYGFSSAAQVYAKDIQVRADGLTFTVVGPSYRFEASTPLVGEYNVSNCLAAAALAIEGLGLKPEDVREGMWRMPAIPGRMERIELGQPFLAIVDFAHTPNALRRALTAGRQMIAQLGEARLPSHSPGRVIAIFGSAGLRDRQKRRMMAEVSAELADLTILTAEDPRTESLAAILAEMAAGVSARGGVEGENFWRVPDRGQAIRFGLSLARPGDIVLALGKGHEQSMCFGEIEYHWDDRIALQAALAEYLGVPGPAMPVLPTEDQP